MPVPPDPAAGVAEAGTVDAVGAADAGADACVSGAADSGPEGACGGAELSGGIPPAAALPAAMPRPNSLPKDAGLAPEAGPCIPEAGLDKPLAPLAPPDMPCIPPPRLLSGDDPPPPEPPPLPPPIEGGEGIDGIEGGLGVLAPEPVDSPVARGGQRGLASLSWFRGRAWTIRLTRTASGTAASAGLRVDRRSSRIARIALGVGGISVRRLVLVAG